MTFRFLLWEKEGLNWREVFKGPLNDDKDFQNQLWLIKTCRDQSWAHPPEGDAESEGTRACLFLIAEVLRKIKRPDKQREVESIRDELFFDDSAERLEKAEKDIAEYKRLLAEVKQRLADVESEKCKYAKDNAALAERVDAKEKQRKKLDRQLKNAKAGNDKLKRDLADTKRRLEKSEAAQADYKERCETTDERLKETKSELAIVSGQFSDVKAEKEHIVTRLAAVQDLFTTATLEKPEIRSIFPPLDANASVRILDRRGVDKKNYLLELMEQKQPTLIYVQSEEMVDLLLERVLAEKADLIERHGEQTSETEEMEILKRLENAELVAVVSDTTFSTIARSHCVEHFVFCHLAPDLDEFFERCQSAFASEKNAYLHLIYESEQDIKEITKKYLDEPTLRKLYEKFRDCTPTVGKFIKPDDLYSELCKQSELKNMTKLGIETSFSIFGELGFLEQNEEGIKRVSPPSTKTQLEKSGTYCRGEKLKKEIANSPAFQYEQSIEQIWEKILEKLDVDGEQILREVNTDEMYSSVSEMENDLQPTETVESESTADNGDTEASQAPKPAPATAKGTEKQFREIRFRSASGESNSELAKEFNLSPPAIRFVAETTEGTRNEIAVKVVELRINKEGSRPIAWKKIREELGLHNDHFHLVIRYSEGYLNAVIERIKSLKSADGGWEYNGKLSALTGIEDIENYLE